MMSIDKKVKFEKLYWKILFFDLALNNRKAKIQFFDGADLQNAIIALEVFLFFYTNSMEIS